MACTKDDMRDTNEVIIVRDTNEVIIEESVTDSFIESDLVCAVGAQITLSTAQNQPFQIDKTCYWCNFCCFKSDNQKYLLQHVMEHRFHCKYCDFQSFSRASVIQHSALEHQSFMETASTLRFCIFLSDILQRNNLKKRGAENSDSQGSAKKLRTEMDEFKPHLDREVLDFDKREDTEFANTVAPSMKAPSAKCFQNPINQDHVEMTSSRNKKENLSVITDAIGGQEAITAAGGINNSHKPNHEVKSREEAETQFAVISNESSRTAEGNMCSSLCWNCGYCDFVTLRQPLLDLHLTSSHKGQRHKHVAKLVSSPEVIEMIKASDLQLSKRHIEDGHSNHHLQLSKNTAATNSSVTTSSKQNDVEDNSFHVGLDMFSANIDPGKLEKHVKGIELSQTIVTEAYNDVVPSKSAPARKCLPYSKDLDNVQITPGTSSRSNKVLKDSAVGKEMLSVITNAIGGQEAITATGGINSSHKPTHEVKSREEVETQFAVIPNEGSRTAEGNMCSSLCWNCGYCGFVTLRQPLLELHLTSSHQGQRHKYVANLVSSQEEVEMIKASDLQVSKSTVEEGITIHEENFSTDIESYNSAGSTSRKHNNIFSSQTSKYGSKENANTDMEHAKLNMNETEKFDDHIVTKKGLQENKGSDTTSNMEVLIIDDSEDTEAESVIASLKKKTAVNYLPATINQDHVKSMSKGLNIVFEVLKGSEEDKDVLAVMTNIIGGHEEITASGETQSPLEATYTSGHIEAAKVVSPSKNIGSDEITVTSGLGWSCHFCDFVTRRQTLLEFHLYYCHQDQSHDTCVAMFISSDEEIERIKSSDLRLSKCLIEMMINAHHAHLLSKAVKSVSSSGAQSADIPLNTSARGFKCPQCRFKSLRLYTVKDHLYEAHSDCVIMYAIDNMAIRLNQNHQYVFFCFKSKCCFATKDVNAFLSHCKSCRCISEGILCNEADDSLAKSLEMTKKLNIVI